MKCTHQYFPGFLFYFSATEFPNNEVKSFKGLTLTANIPSKPLEWRNKKKSLIRSNKKNAAKIEPDHKLNLQSLTFQLQLYLTFIYDND